MRGDAFRRYYSLSQLSNVLDSTTNAVANDDNRRRILFASFTNKCFGSCPSAINGVSLPAPGLVISGKNPDFDGLYWTPTQISSGALNPVIDAQAAKIKAAGYPMVVDFMSEVDTLTDYMDDTTVSSMYGGMTQRDWYESTWEDAFRYWENRLKAQGVTNAVYAVNYAGFRSDSTAYTRTYPGDSYVSWIGYDPYDFRCTKGGVYNTWAPFYNGLEAGMLGEGAKAKNYGLFETGVGGGSSTETCRVEWLNGMAEANARLPKIKAVLYFNRQAADYYTENTSGTASAWRSEIQSQFYNQPHG